MVQLGWGRWSLSAPLKIQLEIRAVSLGREGGDFWIGSLAWQTFSLRPSPGFAHCLPRGLECPRCARLPGATISARCPPFPRRSEGRKNEGEAPTTFVLKGDAGVQKSWGLVTEVKTLSTIDTRAVHSTKVRRTLRDHIRSWGGRGRTWWGTIVWDASPSRPRPAAQISGWVTARKPTQVQARSRPGCLG